MKSKFIWFSPLFYSYAYSKKLYLNKIHEEFYKEDYENGYKLPDESDVEVFRFEENLSLNKHIGVATAVLRCKDRLAVLVSSKNMIPNRKQIEAKLKSLSNEEWKVVK